MKRAVLTAFLSLFTAFFVFSPCAIAQDREHYPIGQVVEIEGKAYFAHRGGRKRAKIEDPIYLNTKIETDAHSKVLILFIDDTQITLAENSELIIDEYIFDPYEPEENIGDFMVTKGAFHWLGGMLSKRERPQVKITTSVGSIGIRGTEFWAGEINDGYGVFVDHGLVDFKGNWGTIELPADSGVFIKTLAGFKPDQGYWSSARQVRAMDRVYFKNQDVVNQRLKGLKIANIRKRHDYRGQVFPYKPNPYNPMLKPYHDQFFTDEFEEFRQGK